MEDKTLKWSLVLRLSAKARQLWKKYDGGIKSLLIAFQSEQIQPEPWSHLSQWSYLIFYFSGSQKKHT